MQLQAKHMILTSVFGSKDLLCLLVAAVDSPGEVVLAAPFESPEALRAEHVALAP